MESDETILEKQQIELFCKVCDVRCDEKASFDHHVPIARDDSKMDMTAMAKIYNFFSFMNFDK